MIDVGKQLTTFLQQVSKNKRIHQLHLSLYSAIMMCYSKSHCHNPFRVTRRQLMQHSAIHSYSTYHRCMSELVDCGCIDYQPSYHPQLGSQITLLNVYDLIQCQS
jgi:hypothetical protein